MSKFKIIDVLPEIYQNILPQLFDQEVPNEKMANCDNCSMQCHSKQDEKYDEAVFKSSKCCTFYPDLPNYLIGALLSNSDNESSEGRRRVVEVINQRRNSTPLEIHMPKKFRLLYGPKGGEIFGMVESLKCPFFVKEGGSCSIWNVRNSYCSTWYCNYNGHLSGQNFWEEMAEYLTITQDALAKYALFSLGFSSDDIEFLRDDSEGSHALTPENMDDQPMQEGTYNDVWGEWAGKEEELYIECYKIISELTSQQFNSILGIEGALMLDSVAQRLNTVNNIPKIMVINPVTKSKGVIKRDVENPDMLKLTLHSRTFEGAIPHRMTIPALVLEKFDGVKTNEQIKQELKDEIDYDLSDMILQRFFHYFILVAHNSAIISRVKNLQTETEI